MKSREEIKADCEKLMGLALEMGYPVVIVSLATEHHESESPPARYYTSYCGGLALHGLHKTTGNALDAAQKKLTYAEDKD